MRKYKIQSRLAHHTYTQMQERGDIDRQKANLVARAMIDILRDTPTLLDADCITLHMRFDESRAITNHSDQSYEPDHIWTIATQIDDQTQSSV